MPKIKYTDYHGPQGDYAVVGGEYVPFTREIALQFSLNAHLLALGDPEYAYKMVAEAEQAECEQTNAA
ncbi:MAG TPA: hypothetical protein VIJ66_13525 [Solirubrobacteraceae bacterium]